MFFNLQYDTRVTRILEQLSNIEFNVKPDFYQPIKTESGRVWCHLTISVSKLPWTRSVFENQWISMNIDEPMIKCFIKHPFHSRILKFLSSILSRLSKRKKENKLWRTGTSGLRESMSAGGEALTILFKIFGDFTIRSR